MGPPSFCVPDDGPNLPLILGLSLGLGVPAIVAAILVVWWIRRSRGRARRQQQKEVSLASASSRRGGGDTVSTENFSMELRTWTDLNSLNEQRKKELRRDLPWTTLRAHDSWDPGKRGGGEGEPSLPNTATESSSPETSLQRGGDFSMSEGGSLVVVDESGQELGEGRPLTRAQSDPFHFLEIRPCELERGELLGSGSYGEVYLGSFMDTQVAIKRVHVSETSNIKDRLVEIKVRA